MPSWNFEKIFTRIDSSERSPNVSVCCNCIEETVNSCMLSKLNSGVSGSIHYTQKNLKKKTFLHFQIF